MKTAVILLVLLVASLAMPTHSIFAQVAPNAPTNLSALAVSASQINLSWIAPANSTVNGYKIEQDVGCLGIFSVLVANTTTTATTYSNTGLLADFCYAYRVFALNSAGSSVPSNVASATTFGVPSAPTGLVVTPLSASSLKLSWQPPQDIGGSKITGYQIQRNGTVLVLNTANNNTVFVDKSLLPLHTQTYRVAAWNSVGLGAFSANVSAKTPSQTVTPLNNTNLGQAVSEFVHKRNELFKMQRNETLSVISQCMDKLKTANSTQLKQIKEDCQSMLKQLKEKYKELRKQYQKDFKIFRETTKSLLKEAKKADLIEKDDVKELEKSFKTVEKQSKSKQKEIKDDLKELSKEFKGLKKGLEKKKGEKHD